MSNSPFLTLAGTGDLALIPDTKTPPSAETEYDAASAAFGNIKELTILNETEIKKHFGSYRGVRILDHSVTTQISKGYKLKCDEVDAKAIKALYFASQETDITTPAPYEVFTPFGLLKGLRGMFRVRLWDAFDREYPVLVHKDFYGVLHMEGDLTLGEDFSEYEFRLDVLDPVGTVLLKKRS